MSEDTYPDDVLDSDDASPEEAARLRAALADIAAIDLQPLAVVGAGFGGAARVPGDGVDDPIPVLQLVADSEPAGSHGGRRHGQRGRRRWLLPAAGLLVVAAVGTAVVANRDDRVGIAADGPGSASSASLTRLIPRAIPSDLTLFHVSDMNMDATSANDRSVHLVSDARPDGRPGRVTVSVSHASEGPPAVPAMEAPAVEMGGGVAVPAMTTTAPAPAPPAVNGAATTILDPTGLDPTGLPATTFAPPPTPPPPTMGTPPQPAPWQSEQIERNGRAIDISTQGDNSLAHVAVDDCQISVAGAPTDDVIEVAATVGCERRDGAWLPVVNPPTGYRLIPARPQPSHVASIEYQAEVPAAPELGRMLNIGVLTVPGDVATFLQSALATEATTSRSIAGRTVYSPTNGETNPAIALVWAEHGVVISLSGQGLTDNEIEALVAKFEVVDEATWQDFAATAKNPSPNFPATTVCAAAPGGATVPPSLRLVPATVPDGAQLTVRPMPIACGSGGAALVQLTGPANDRGLALIADAGGEFANNKSGAAPGRSVKAGERTLVFLEGGVPIPAPVNGQRVIQATFDTPDGMVYVNATGYTDDELVALVAGLRTASEEEWAKLLASSGDGAMVVASGSVTAESGTNGNLPIPTTTTAGR